ncbi:MAG: lamin tail domain-containing protein, partial [Verrucomicrobiota bacterium]
NELVNEYSNTSKRFQTWLELEDNSTGDQGCDINRYIRWGEGRKAAANRELGDARTSAFSIATNEGDNFSTTNDIITIEGKSPVDVYEVFIEGHPEAEIRWTGTVEYELSGIALKEGENVLTVRGRDQRGKVLGSLFSPKKDAITVTKTTPSKPYPVLDINPGSLNVSLGGTLEIDASESWDPEGEALTYAFNAPAGVAIAADGPRARLAFDQPGVYTVSVSITNAGGNSIDVVRDVAVYGGSEGFDSFAERRIADYWTEENVEAQTTRHQERFYTLGDPDGTLGMVVTADSEQSLGNGSYPTIHRELPADEDFLLQTRLELANLQFGGFQTGLMAEATVGGETVRYVFGIKDGKSLTLSEIKGGTVTDLESVDYLERWAKLRIHRSGSRFHFQYGSDDDRWIRVASIGVEGDMVFTRGGLALSTEEPAHIRVLFSYGMLIDGGQVSDLQADLRLTEVMYNPGADQNLEFLEMQNVGTGSIDLTGAHFTDGIDYTFDKVQVAAGQILILAKDPSAFAAAYDAKGARVVGGFAGRLSNGGETIELVDADKRLIFSFSYDDAEPWAADADGLGKSLEVVDPAGSLNDPTNWRASVAENGSPGVGGAVVEPNPDDMDGDGIPNAWEAQFGLNPDQRADGAGDADDDGVSNVEEYLANTDPTDAGDYLTLTVTRTGSMVSIGFTRQPDRRYTVEYTDALASAQWTTLEEFAAEATAGEVTGVDSNGDGSPMRFYRVKAQP